MSNNQQIANVPGGALANSDAFELSDEQVKTLVSASIIPAGTPKPQIAVFQQFCKSTGLNPFIKQCYLMVFNSKQGKRYLNFTSIEGLRAIANRSGVHAGTSDAMYNMKRNGEYETPLELKLRNQNRPITCTVIVKKIMPNGNIAEFPHTILVDEFYGQNSRNPLKNSLIFQLSFKCAESFALKKAFPEEMASVYIPEQTEYIENETVSANTPNTDAVNPNVKVEFADDVDATIVETPDSSRQMLLDDWKEKLKQCRTKEAFMKLLKDDVNDEVKADAEIMELVLLWKQFMMNTLKIDFSENVPHAPAETTAQTKKPDSK